MIIAVDIDMTILACDSLIYQIANDYFSGHCKPKLTYTSVNDVTITKDKLINKILKTHNYKTYRVLENSTEILKKWMIEKYKIVLLSTRSAKDGLRNALLKCIIKFDIVYDQIILECTNKALYCKENKVDVIVDNSPIVCRNCKKVGVPSICYMPNLKRSEKLKKECLLVATSWDEVEQEVKKINKNKKNRNVLL